MSSTLAASAQFAPLDQSTWVQVADLAIALVLAAVIGFERELRAKSAGLRTHTLVGVGSALFMLMSKYGFEDMLGTHVNLDPSRIAAGVVSGIGFIGGGLIFVRGDAVRGLTTAASVWVASAVGMAAGAGLWALAIAGTIAHLIVVYVVTAVARRLPSSDTAPSSIDLLYRAGEGTLGTVLQKSTRAGFSVVRVNVASESSDAPDTRRVRFMVTGKSSLADLTVHLEEVEGVLSVSAEDANADID